MLLSVEVGWQYDTNHIPTGASKPLTEPALPSFLPLLYTSAAIWLYGLGAAKCPKYSNSFTGCKNKAYFLVIRSDVLVVQSILG